MYLTSHSQTFTTVILPQYIQGNTGTNSNRIPFACRARLTGLRSNSTYRFLNQVVVSTDVSSISGAGNCIFTSTMGDFIHTSGPDLSSTGNYGTFITNGIGSYEGWFITEPTGNKRFIPGKYVFMRMTLNDGSGGTTPVTLLTTADSMRVVKLDTAITDSTGTGLRCTSAANPKDFIFTYDNIAGLGRPISGSFIENDGTDNTVANNYAPFYANHVDGIDGAFGVILPNNLVNGIRYIERRSLITGALVVFAKDADGVWPSGASTVNPSGGIHEIVLAGTDVQWTDDVQKIVAMPTTFAMFQNYPNPFNPMTVIKYQLPVASHVVIKVYDVLGREVSTVINETKAAGYYSVNFNASALSSGIYFYRVIAGSYARTKQMVLIK